MKRCFATLITTILLFILAGSGHAKKQEKLIPVTLQLKWRHQFNFAGYYAAKEKGFFKEAGLDVTIKEGLPGTDFIEEVVAGRADYGIEMPDLLIARSKGVPVVVLAAMFQHSPYILLTREDSGISSPQDVSGKTVMMRQASAAELRAMFINEGIDLRNINFVPHTWNLKDLIDGKVDAMGAYVTDQPYRLKLNNVEPHIIRPISYGIDFYGDCLFTTESKLKNDQKQVEAFRAACIKGWAYAMENPEELIGIIKDKYKSGYTRESMRYEYDVLMKEIMLPDLVEIGHMNPGRWEHICNTYKILNIIPADYSIDGFIYNPQDYMAKDWLDERWVRISLSAIGISFIIAVGAIISLSLFNKRLSMEVERQTKEIVEKEEQFRALFNNYFQLTGMLDIDGRLTMVNTAALSMIGKEKEDVIGHYFWETPWWEHSSNLQQMLKSAIDRARKGELVRFDTTHLTADGETHYIDFSIKPVKDNDGNIISLLPEGRDITEKKLSEERYQKLFDQAGDAIIILKAGKVIDCNQKALEIFECDRDWLIGTTPEDISLDLQEGVPAKELLANIMQDVLVNGNVHFEWRHITAKGNNFIGSVSLSRLMFGNSDYIQGIIRDISASKEFERKLRLAQKMEAIGTLAGGIAHDFNNILAGIMGFSELAMHEAESGTKIEFYLREMLKSTDRAKELVDQILTFSRHSEQGKRSIVASNIIQEALKLLRATIPAYIELKADIQSECRVLADPTQLHQVIMNLCTNAYHALDHNSGKITVTLKEQILTDEDNKYGLPLGTYARLDVADTGTGMDQATMQKIFEPYFTTKEVGKGTGLGLAVVHGIIASHHGYIGVDSTLGKGSTFTILLPTTPDAPLEPEEIIEDHDTHGKGKHVLFVDDEEPIVRLSSETLRRAGYEVSGYTKPKEALEAFKSNPDSFDIVISDMTMPELTGQQMVVDMLKTRENIPVIMCSGYNETMNRARALEAGVKEYLLKPVSTRTLISTVKELLD